MAIKTKKNIQYKLMEKADILISLDRLTRFKDPADKYLRVYTDIITKFLVSPRLTKKQIELLDPSEINKYVELIWNESVDALFSKNKYSGNYKNILKIFDEFTFTIANQDIKKLAAAKLNILPILESLSAKDNLPQNLILLKKLLKSNTSKKIDKDSLPTDAISLRKKHKLKFPISKLVLVEGITEEILLPEFAKILDYDFNKNGVFVLGTGGKSKVIQLYNKYKHILKAPIIILLDNDAMPVFEQIKKNLKRKDKAMIIQKGEFEDILPLNLIKRAINATFYDIEKIKLKELKLNTKMCKTLSEIYRTRGIGEFQKAHFAYNLASYITNKKDASIEIEDIINYIAAANITNHLDSFLI